MGGCVSVCGHLHVCAHLCMCACGGACAHKCRHACGPEVNLGLSLSLGIQLFCLPWHWDYKHTLPCFVFYIDVEIELKPMVH